MTTTPSTSRSAIDLRRLWWVGPLTILAAIGAVLATRVLAFAFLDLSPQFVPFMWGALIVFTTVLVAAAVLVFAAVARLATSPIRTYRRIALGALVVSMIPDLLLPAYRPNATWPAVLVLLVMHVAAWWTTVTTLTGRATERSTRPPA